MLLELCEENRTVGEALPPYPAEARFSSFIYPEIALL